MKRKGDDRQLSLDSLFEIPKPQEPTAGSLECARELRAIVSDTLKRCPLNRYEVAAKMSELTGRDIAKTQLDAWSAESRAEWRFPLELAPAFETATNTFVFTEFLARKQGCKVYSGDDVPRAELGRLESMKDEINQQIKQLKQLMMERGR